ncbi:MAG: Ala-tRNA(Pro) deacylase [Eubacteriaceae bacterium]|jgi:Ala-tRNA(Pro) deacylase|nr:Ala-tRNA(Pro) deacylase [Eubacteriaceae bacterium]MDK2936968.1 Ala-tRNA(Pro) deacylase [Eubacteriaceae bacterium]MDK2960908.1 Ala-tRNA(Pro) deacylase [Eubacteriaceae bacterium]MDN5306861.1 Ala-tRNA(Pro) deacylase [Eubacteriaceae bacterium]
MSENAKKVFDKLDELKIEYSLVEHPPVYTCEELENYITDLSGVHCKNLFLRNKKGNRHFLLVTDESRQINIKEFGKKIEVSNLSFASGERLMKYLGVETGAVSVFGTLNDLEKQVEVIIDQDILKESSINCHPNDNTKTISFSSQDLKKYLDQCEQTVTYIKL